MRTREYVYFATEKLSNLMPTREQLEMYRRRRAQLSLHSFALSIDIPTVPFFASEPDETLTGPAEFLMTIHHSKILGVCERTMNKPMGRALIVAPPGSAKSTYVSVVATAWEMGRHPGARLILTSYGATLAERQSKRVLQIVKQEKYRELWPEMPVTETEAAGSWKLNNQSEMLASGLTSGITGNRASGAVVDDPTAGREDADSEAMQQKTVDSYQDDLLSRLLPDAWLIIIMTHWNESDLAGKILPDDWKGESGIIRCKDGLDWEVLCITAKCEAQPDPLGRADGDYLWPEFMPPRHWQQFENAPGREAQRAWSSLYQQRPTPTGSGTFTREMIGLYDPGQLPTRLTYIGASDFAVTAGKNDFTEHGCFGMDEASNLWAVDWYFKQCTTDKGLDEWIKMAKRWKSKTWFNEGGVIDKAIRPAANSLMKAKKYFCNMIAIPSMADKLAKVQSFQARAGAGCVWFPRNAPWTEHVIAQLLALPAGRHDDAADVCGLIGRALDDIRLPQGAPAPRGPDIKPFTQKWLEYEENKKPPLRWR
jgi:predicted phage terminase large subunit-like protein